METHKQPRYEVKPKRILVTGGAGFVGSHLCDALLAQGHHVTALDNLSTGSSRNIKHLLSHPKFEMQLQDVCDPIQVCCDAIYHLASPASPIHYQEDPVATIRTNVTGTMNVLELAKKLMVPVFLSSTSEVYGDPEMHPQKECYWGNVNPVGPRSCYDEAKRCAETLCYSYHHQHGVPVRIARFFNTYGPRMHVQDGRVVSNFIVQALAGDPITVYGEGQQTRSFCYVSDLVEAIIRLMECSGGYVGPMNLGNPQELTVRQLAETVLMYTDSGSEIIEKPLPQDDPKRRRPDISLAGELLSWEPVVSVEEGLKKTIEYFRPLVARSKAVEVREAS